MELENILASLIPSVGAVLGVWVKMSTEVAKLKGRVQVLERDRSEIKDLVKECVDGIQELKLLIARKGYDT